MKERILSLDILKGFLILTVVLGHIIEGDSVLNIIIYTFHMPLFLILSGVLTKINYQTNTLKHIKHKVYTLVVPYIVFCLTDVLFSIIISKGLTGDIKSELVGVLIGKGAGPAWFLMALFIADTLFLLLTKIFKNTTYRIILILILFLIGLNGGNLFNDFMLNYFYLIAIYRAFIALGFFAVGAYGVNYIRNLKNIKNSSAFILLLISLVLGVLNGRVGLFNLEFGNKILYVFNSIASSIAFIFIFEYTFNKSNKIFQYLGMNTLIIMGTHQIIIESINLFTNSERYDYLSSVVIFFAVMVMEIPIIYLINNYAPWILGKFKHKQKIEKKEVRLA